MPHNSRSNLKAPPRCRWVKDALLAAYHDQRWGKLTQDEHILWEYFILEMFQAGLSWRTVLAKKEAFNKAFFAFDPQKMANLTAEDIDSLLHNPDIIRSRRKISSAIHNAGCYCKLLKQGLSFNKIVADAISDAHLTVPMQDEKSTSQLSLRLTHIFKSYGFVHIGPVIIQSWLQAIGVLNGHEVGCFLYPTSLKTNP